MLQFKYISILHLSSKTNKQTNECNTTASIQELILTLNFISRFRPPLKAFLVQVALPVEFSNPHRLFQGWLFLGPLNRSQSLHDNPSPSDHRGRWVAQGRYPLLPASCPACWLWWSFSTQGCPHTCEPWWEPQLCRECCRMPEEMNLIH